MEYIIQQKVLAFIRTKYEIRNSEGTTIYNVKSNAAGPLRITFYDLDNKPVILLKKRYFRFFDTYDIISDDNSKIARIKAKFSPFSKKFDILSEKENLNDLSIGGDIFGLKFDILSNNLTVASISKKLFKIGDRYSLKLDDESNTLIYLAIVVALDDIVHNKKKKNRSRRR